MTDTDQQYIEIPTGRLGLGQPDVIPIIKIPFPKGINPVDLEIRSDSEEQTIANSTAQTLHWHDSLERETATAEATLLGAAVDSLNLVGGGFNYSLSDNLIIVGDGTGATASILTVGLQGNITSVLLGAGGSGYTAATVLTQSFSGGFGAEITPNLATAGIDTIALTNPGSGYSDVPIVTITGDGTGATATASIDTFGVVTEIVVDTAGTGYNASTTVVELSAPTGLETPILEDQGATLCIVLADGDTAIDAGDLELWATDAIDVVDEETDQLLFVSHTALSIDEFLYPSSPIWLPQLKYLTVNNTSGSNTITINRVQTINFKTFP